VAHHAFDAGMRSLLTHKITTTAAPARTEASAFVLIHKTLARLGSSNHNWIYIS
jgi:hypothetical protein